MGVGPYASGIDIWNGPGHAIVRNNMIISDMACINVRTYYVDLDIHGNHILQSGGQGWFARVGTLPYSGPPVHFDLSNNWWGTTDVDYIAEWIYAGHDDPTVNYFFDFEPFADGPVSVESRIWTEVKGLFRE